MMDRERSNHVFSFEPALAALEKLAVYAATRIHSGRGRFAGRLRRTEVSYDAEEA